MFERKFSQNLSSKTMLSLALVGVYWALMAFSAQTYAAPSHDFHRVIVTKDF